MSIDDVLIAVTLSGMCLAVAYLGVGLIESRRLHNLELRRRELAGTLQRATDRHNRDAPGNDAVVEEYSNAR